MSETFKPLGILNIDESGKLKWQIEDGETQQQASKRGLDLFQENPGMRELMVAIQSLVQENGPLKVVVTPAFEGFNKPGIVIFNQNGNTIQPPADANREWRNSSLESPIINQGMMDGFYASAHSMIPGMLTESFGKHTAFDTMEWGQDDQLRARQAGEMIIDTTEWDYKEDTIPATFSPIQLL